MTAVRNGAASHPGSSTPAGPRLVRGDTPPAETGSTSGTTRPRLLGLSDTRPAGVWGAGLTRPVAPIPTATLMAALDGAGSAITIVDAWGQIISATGALEKLLKDDRERTIIWATAQSLVAELTRLEARPLAGGRRPSTDAGGQPRCRAIDRVVQTGAGAYRIVASRPLAAESEWTVVLFEALSGRAAARSSRVDMLSERERRVADLLARGATTATVGAELGISIHTVRHHTERIYEKLGVRTRAALGAILTASTTADASATAETDVSTSADAPALVADGSADGQ